MSVEKRGTTHYCPACKAPVDRVDTVCLNCEASRPPTGWPVDSYVGRTLGKKYRIDSRHSVGGFGVVFLATQVHQGQELGTVIIKMLHPEHAFDPVITKRFVNEVKAARSVVNPHVVKIFDMDFDHGNVPYMVQEFVQGQGLADILEKQLSMPISRAVSIALQVAEGMEEAHQQDIVHRDLKPENIILQKLKRTDFVKIIDFGIARVTNPDGMVTRSFVGTPRYMSPEQIRGKKIDGRADIFALGVILFEMIAGRPPILAADSDLEYLTLNPNKEPDRLRQVDPLVPEDLDSLVYRMMAKDPEDRPASMREVAESLSAISSQMGYAMELTGEWSIGSDLATEVDSPIRQLLKTPVSGDYSLQVARRRGAVESRPPPDPARDAQQSVPFTHERVASGHHQAAPEHRVSLPAVAIAVGAGAFAVVVAAGVVLIILMSMRPADGPAPAGASTKQPPVLPERADPSPPPVEATPSVASPDAIEPVATQPAGPADEEAPGATTVEQEPATPPEPATPEPATPEPRKPPDKKPPDKKPPKKKDDTPWTKL